MSSEKGAEEHEVHKVHLYPEEREAEVHNRCRKKRDAETRDNRCESQRQQPLTHFDIQPFCLRASPCSLVGNGSGGGTFSVFYCPRCHPHVMACDASSFCWCL